MAKTAIINVRLLAASALMASTEETRPYLRGVLLEITNAGVYYVATDGHRIIVSWRGPGDAQCRDWIKSEYLIIPTDECKRAKIKRGSAEDATLTLNDDGTVTIQHDITWTFKPIDGTYPDWRRVIPREQDKDELARAALFNPAYLMSYQTFADKLEFGKVILNQRDGSSPMPVTFSGHEGGISKMSFGIIMPMRGDTPRWFAPVWMNYNAPPEAEAPERDGMGNKIDGTGEEQF